MKRFPDFDLLPYQPISVEEVIAIFFSLKDEVPSIVKILGARSFNESIFRRDINFVREKDDLSYLIHYDLSLSSQDPKPVAVNDLNQSEQFIARISRDKKIAPDTDNNEQTVLYILTKIVTEISFFWNMVSIHQMKVTILDEDVYKALFPVFLDQDRIALGKDLREYHLLDIPSFSMNFDLAIFYRAVFRALKRIGYEFEFRSNDCAAILEHIRECKDLQRRIEAGEDCQSFYESEMAELREILDSFKISDIDPLDEEAFCAALSEALPKTELAPYFDVYGKYPYKFPLRASDYKPIS
ncbi:hypothetical protein [Sphingobacterium sp. DR205]|uniref:hypothetical protein n=1 Tax=Sphingobacterium sp. DR205 TaxID=2713573 RepID=UPI0013E45607|nr:hypothetical protein [Sphingobacterium sp. DR205]QIH34121.1 hypothetical protein G6053_15045 [Sphingobacterium sp. DR205]